MDGWDGLVGEMDGGREGGRDDGWDGQIGWIGWKERDAWHWVDDVLEGWGGGMAWNSIGWVGWMDG